MRLAKVYKDEEGFKVERQNGAYSTITSLGKSGNKLSAYENDLYYAKKTIIATITNEDMSELSDGIFAFTLPKLMIDNIADTVRYTLVEGANTWNEIDAPFEQLANESFGCAYTAQHSNLILFNGIDLMTFITQQKLVEGNALTVVREGNPNPFTLELYTLNTKTLPVEAFPVEYLSPVMAYDCGEKYPHHTNLDSIPHYLALGYSVVLQNCRMPYSDFVGDFTVGDATFVGDVLCISGFYAKGAMTLKINRKASNAYTTICNGFVEEKLILGGFSKNYSISVTTNREIIVTDVSDIATVF